jgi:hypothetical protein
MRCEAGQEFESSRSDGKYSFAFPAKAGIHLAVTPES